MKVFKVKFIRKANEEWTTVIASSVKEAIETFFNEFDSTSISYIEVTTISSKPLFAK